MPNFQTHRVVAWEALKGLGGPAAQAQKSYEELGRVFGDKLRLAVEQVRSKDDVRSLAEKLSSARNGWAENRSAEAVA